MKKINMKTPPNMGGIHKIYFNLNYYWRISIKEKIYENIKYGVKNKENYW